MRTVALFLAVLLWLPFTSTVAFSDDDGDTAKLKPKIDTRRLMVDPILNNADPVFKVRNVVVNIPGLMRRDSMQQCKIEVHVKSSNIADLKSGVPYTVVVVNVDSLRQRSLEEIQQTRVYAPKPEVTQRELPPDWLPEPPKKAEINADSLRYSATFDVTLRLVDGKIPLTKGRVKGPVFLTYIATFTDTQGAVHRCVATQPILVSN